MLPRSGCLAAALVLLAAGQARAEPPASPPDPVTVEAGVRLGGLYRFGGAPAFSITGRGGPLFGVGIGIAPSSRFSVGLAYEHGGLGSEHGQGDLGVVDLDRSIDAVWASVRLTLFRVDGFSLGVVVGPGLVWQSVAANVIAFDGSDFQPDAYRCSDSGGPGLGLRAGLGGELALAGGFFFTLDAHVDELRLGDGPLGTCAPGAGSTAVLGVRGGLGYRIDVSRFVR